MGTNGRRYALVVGGASVCLAVAGCGGATPKLSAPTPRNGSINIVLAAYTHTLAAKSAQVTLKETVTSGTKSVSVTGSGPVDFNGRAGEFTYDFPTVGAVTMRLISPVIYLELPAKARTEIPGHKPWVSLNLNALYKAKLGTSLSQLSSSSQTPTQTLSYLQSVSTSGVHRIAAVNLGGVATTQYDATIDLTKVAATKDAAAKAAIANLEAELHRSTYPMQVWIDRADRVRQLAYQIAIPATASTPSSNLAVTIGFSGFGAALHVAAPPKAQTYDITEQTVNAGTTTN